MPTVPISAATTDLEMPDMQELGINEYDSSRPTVGRCNEPLPDGGWCPSHPLKGKDKCRHHYDRKQDIFGARSQEYVPLSLLDRFETYITDASMLDMRNEIALIDTRISELVERLDQEDRVSDDAMDRLRRSLRLLKRYISENREKGINRMLSEMSTILAIGSTQADQWAEIVNLINERRRVVEFEHKRMQATHQMITAEQAMALMAAVIDTIKRNVRDREILVAISEDVAKLLAGTPVGQLEGRS